MRLHDNDGSECMIATGGDGEWGHEVHGKKSGRCMHRWKEMERCMGGGEAEDMQTNRQELDQ